MGQRGRAGSARCGVLWAQLWFGACLWATLASAADYHVAPAGHDRDRAAPAGRFAASSGQ